VSDVGTFSTSALERSDSISGGTSRPSDWWMDEGRMVLRRRETGGVCGRWKFHNSSGVNGNVSVGDVPDGFAGSVSKPPPRGLDWKDAA
jgi:hypothetical protein